MGEAGGSPKVLSVVGAGRSGTTVLASILDEVDGFTSAGELRWLWERGRSGRPSVRVRPPPERVPGLGAGRRHVASAPRPPDTAPRRSTT